MNHPARRWLLARCLCVALLTLAAAPVAARDPERLDDVVELARLLPTGVGGERPVPSGKRMAEAVGTVHRAELTAATVRYDRRAGVFHLRLLTSDGRIPAGVKVDRRGSYLARTREGQQFWIRREDVTIYELEVVEGEQLARDLAIPAPPSFAHGLLSGLVADCEFRVVEGADGLAARRTVEDHQTSLTDPVDGRITTYVIRVALESVTLRPPTPEALDPRLTRSPAVPVRTRRAAMHD